MRLVLVAAIALCAAGCLHDNLETCGDLVCPAGTTCVLQLATCAAADQVDACNGLADLAPCTPTSSAPGTCLDGVCVRYCGDGVVEAGEQCDDGNTNPADGCDACKLTSWTATPLVGGNTSGLSIALNSADSIAADHAGNVFIGDSENCVIWRLDGSGVITRIAGNFTFGESGDGGPATSAALDRPEAIAVDGAGNIYIAEHDGNRIRRIDQNGTITTIAGNGTATFAGDHGPAVAASLNAPTGVAVDGLGVLYIADTANARIRKLDTDGVITTFAGTGTFGNTGDGGLATAASIAVWGVAVAPDGDLYFSDQSSEIRRIDSTGHVYAVAGDGITTTDDGDGGPAIDAHIGRPYGLTVGGAGDVYFAERDNFVVRRIDPSGIITRFAGNAMYGYSGDGGPAVAAQLNDPYDAAVDGAGNVYIADSSNAVIRRVAPNNTITTVAGNGFYSQVGDGGAATSALIYSGITGIAFDSNNALYFSDSTDERIRKVDATGVISTYAGNGSDGFSGDGGPATGASMVYPQQIAFDAADNLYITDEYNYRIRRVDPAGTIATIAGDGTCSSSQPSGPAVDYGICIQHGIAVDANGDVFVDDNNAVYEIDSTGAIGPYAGTGSQGQTGDGSAAVDATLALPTGLALDGAGGVLIADTYNNKIRRVDAAGNIQLVAGNGSTGTGSFGDGGLATAAQLAMPSSAVADSNGDVFIADVGHDLLRRIDATTHLISTASSTTSLQFSGDGGALAGAGFTTLDTLAYDHAGNLYVADASVVRKIEPSGRITTVAGQVDPYGMGPLAQAQLTDPRALVIGNAFSLVAGGTSGTVQGIGVTQPSWVSVVAGAYPQPVATGNLARFRETTFGPIGGVALDEAAGLIYLTETGGNRVHVVTIVDAHDPSTWTIAPLANAAGTAGFADGAAATAQLRAPTGLYLDTAAHVLYVADTGNHVIRAIDLASGPSSATVRTIAGTPATLGYFGDGGAATSALLYSPEAITKCGNGDLFVADTSNNRIRRIDASGTITTVLGDGVAASSGQGSPASTFPVDTPRGLACDSLGNLYATSRVAVRELPADANGVVDGSGLVRSIYGAPPRTAFPASVTRCLTGIAVVDAATLQVVDSCTGLLLQLVRQ